MAQPDRPLRADAARNRARVLQVAYASGGVTPGDRYQWILDVNPVAGLLTAWSDVLIAGQAPEASAMLQGLAWGVGVFVAAGLFFLSREREFAVRL